LMPSFPVPRHHFAAFRRRRECPAVPGQLQSKEGWLRFRSVSERQASEIPWSRLRRREVQAWACAGIDQKLEKKGWSARSRVPGFDG
jgi:hypothetical protein